MNTHLSRALLYTGGAGASQERHGESPMFARQITDDKILKVLAVGFSLVILLLVVAGVAGIGNLRSIKSNAASLVREQGVSTSLIDEMQREQGNLNSVFYTLGQGPDLIDEEQVQRQLDVSDREIERIVNAASGSGDEALWRTLRSASMAFSKECRRLLALENAESLSSRDLLRRHEEVLTVVAKLIEASHAKSRATRQQIETQAHGLVVESSALLGTALLLALLFASLTMRMTTDLFRRMEQQTGELSRVSWQLLENQESVARRFSHELHDELGQSLTAIKANLLSMKGTSEPGRMDDCVHLVDESIQNVREMSQLLRPTILDDFGLDASLRSLTEKFQQRTGTVVDYESNFTGRLADESETHVFRIAQEALTNVARHSGATKVHMQLGLEDSRLRLSVSDNGRGITDEDAIAPGGLGLSGMRARARSAGGELLVKPSRNEGLTVEVCVPVRLRTE